MFHQLVPAKRASSEMLEDAIQKTGNKKIDTKAAKAVVKKQKEEIFNTMGIVGFGKDGKDQGFLLEVFVFELQQPFLKWRNVMLGNVCQSQSV